MEQELQMHQFQQQPLPTTPLSSTIPVSTSYTSSSMMPTPIDRSNPLMSLALAANPTTARVSTIPTERYKWQAKTKIIYAKKRHLGAFAKARNVPLHSNINDMTLSEIRQALLAAGVSHLELHELEDWASKHYEDVVARKPDHSNLPPAKVDSLKNGAAAQKEIYEKKRRLATYGRTHGIQIPSYHKIPLGKLRGMLIQAGVPIETMYSIEHAR